MVKENKARYMDLVMLMNDMKSFNLVKECEGNLYQAWIALRDEYEPMTADVMIGLLGESNT